MPHQTFAHQHHSGERDTETQCSRVSCDRDPKSYSFITSLVVIWGGILFFRPHVSDFSDCIRNHLFTSRKKKKSMKIHCHHHKKCWPLKCKENNVNVKLSSRKPFPRAFLWGKSVTSSGIISIWLPYSNIWKTTGFREKKILCFSSLLFTFSAEGFCVAGAGHGSWRTFCFQDLPAAASGFLSVTLSAKARWDFKALRMFLSFLDIAKTGFSK